MKLLTFLLLIISSSVWAERSKVATALEVLPPLVTNDGQGLVVEMLKRIEDVSNYSFDILIMTYARGKRELQGERVQLIGLTPKNEETEEFYRYAQELAWGVNVSVDLFVKNPEYVNKYKEIYIGVPTGNADFFSELFDIPRKNFIEVTHLDQLTQMLSFGRIDGIIFERTSLAETFKKTGYQDIYYHQLTAIDASLAVSNSPAGHILKNDLDYYIKKIDIQQMFADYNHYFSLPTSGKVSVLIERPLN